MKTVLVLLSAYNGEKYIEEQIDSILKQKGIRVQILVRDDGSSDSTPEILRRYSEKYDNVWVKTEPNIGCKKSFYTLLKYAAEMHAKFDYYAFSDQDDYWLEDKLQAAVAQLEKSEKNYRFYSSASTLVDEKLNPLPSLKRSFENDTLGSNIISSHILGCSIVFSYTLLPLFANCYDLMISFPDYLIPYHDAYTSLVAFALDSFVVYDHSSYLLYRQHNDNLVGGSGENIINAQMKRLKSPYRRFTKIRILLSTINHSLIGNVNLLLLKNCADANKSLKTRIRLIFNKSLRTPSFKHNAFFWFNLLIKRW